VAVLRFETQVHARTDLAIHVERGIGFIRFASNGVLM
jgi:hypothetical protein